jgi:glutamyl-tRNA synthetase
MADEMMDAVIRKYALQNAVFYNGKANPKSVIGKIMGECPEYRQRSKELAEAAERVVSEVNAMDPKAQADELGSIDSDMLIREKKEKVHGLPDLDGVEGKVVMRIAPGPSGPLHIGHTRVGILNDEYVKRYGGKLICRFEDTNPDKIEPDAYDMIKEDLEWLGVDISEYAVQSERFEYYYDVTKKLIEMGHGYMCTCDADEWRRMKEDMKPCPCRDLSAEENLRRYERFLSGGYADGEAVAVIKTAIDHPNPAIRDFVALRLVRHPHPRTGTKYIAYPMMNLSVAVDDHMMGMTHVIRGKDHLNNTHRQEYIYDYMGWKKPEFYHYGLVNIPDTVLKTSLIKQSIKDGEYSGWDDVRTGTVRALRKRGIRPEAIRRYWVENGIKPIDIQFSWDNLFAMNRDLIDDTADRYFFVADPVRYDIEGGGDLEGRAPLHPDHPERGWRCYQVGGHKTVFLSETDSLMFSQAGRVRLKDLCNISYGLPAQYDGNDVSILREGVRAIQWVCNDSVPAEVLMPDGTSVKGLAEKAVLDGKGDMVQFERFGFVRIERRSPEGVLCIFAHR